MASSDARNCFLCDQNCPSPHVQVHEEQLRMGLVQDESQPCMSIVCCASAVSILLINFLIACAKTQVIHYS